MFERYTLNCTCLGVKLLHHYLFRVEKRKILVKGIKSYCYTCLGGLIHWPMQDSMLQECYGQGFFSKFLVPVSSQRGRSRMGGGLAKKKIRLKPKLPT